MARGVYECRDVIRHTRVHDNRRHDDDDEDDLAPFYCISLYASYLHQFGVDGAQPQQREFRLSPPIHRRSSVRLPYHIRRIRPSIFTGVFTARGCAL